MIFIFSELKKEHMKVLLIQPPIEDFYNTNIRTYPLGLMYLAKKVENECDVKIIDFRTNIKPEQKANPFPELNEYYKENLFSPFSLFKGYKRFGASEKEIKRCLETEKPFAVCISSLFSPYSEEALSIAKIAKEIDKSIITIIGGTHPTVLPEFTLKHPYVDYVIRGEGETPFYKLLISLKKGISDDLENIKGVCFKKNGQYVISPINIEEDLNTIPARFFVDPKHYRIGKKRYTFFLTSRGCPFKCSFCGRLPVPYRKKGIDIIENELEQCIRLGIEWIDFEDDMLTYDMSHFKKILKMFSNKGLVLSAMNGIYTGTLKKEIIKDMIHAGFKRLNLSIVDISHPVIKSQKRFDNSAFLEILPYLESSELLLEIHFIIGLPNQRLEHILDTIIFLSSKRCLLGPSAYYLVPGIDHPGSFLDSNFEEKLKYMRSSVLLPINPHISRTDLFTVMKLVRFINFLKNIIDRFGHMHLSEVPKIPQDQPNEPIVKEILKTLIEEKRFIAYNKNKKAFENEKCNNDIIETFFRHMKGHYIKGYRTHAHIEF